jgi:hypothetical protein
MVLGQPSSGKTTVVKNLVNMALSSGMGWNVGVASLDPSSVSLRRLTHIVPCQLCRVRDARRATNYLNWIAQSAARS